MTSSDAGSCSCFVYVCPMTLLRLWGRTLIREKSGIFKQRGAIVAEFVQALADVIESPMAARFLRGAGEGVWFPATGEFL